MHISQINCIRVALIPTRFLVAEYQCILRMPNMTSKCTSTSDIPANYTLGRGHLKFFYDKGEYLRRRLEEEIIPELRKRGVNVTTTKYKDHPEGMNYDWEPSEEDKIACFTRLVEFTRG